MELAELTTLVQRSKALKEPTRLRLLEVLPRLNPAARTDVAFKVQTADARVAAMEEKIAERRASANQRVKARGDEILHHELPALIKTMETQDRAAEDSSLETLLNGLN